MSENVREETGERDKFISFLQSVAFRATTDLRKTLSIDEPNFRFVAPFALGKSKDVYLYRVLDEIQKAGVSLRLWQEYLSDTGDSGRFGGQLERVVFESVFDDQSFRARKLTEALVDLICFSRSDEEVYFRDFFLLRDMDEAIRAQQDRKEFYAFTSMNSAFVIERDRFEIEGLEKNGLDPVKRWYLKTPTALKLDWLSKGVPFASFRQRYMKAIAYCLPNEHVVLGKSYIHAYGTSKDVHFTADDTSSDFSPHDAWDGVHRVGLLCLALVFRCQIALNAVPEGINRSLREMHETNAYPKSLVEDLKTEKAVAGDFVSAAGDLAEVVESKASTYGFRSFRVRYLERAPIPRITEDSFAGFQIKLFMRRKDLEPSFDKIASHLELPESERPRISQLTKTDRDALARETAKTLWNARHPK